MEHILQSLEQNIILSDEIVLDIKQSIRRNHPSADSRYRARLLAQSLHEKLDQNLDGLSDQQRTKVRVSIFKNSIESSRLQVSQKDLIHEVVNSNMKSLDVFEYMADWFCNYTDITLEYDQLHDFINTINPQIEIHLPQIEEFHESHISISAKIENTFTNLVDYFKKVNFSIYYKIVVILFSFILALPVFYVAQKLLQDDATNHSMTFVHASAILLHKPRLEYTKEEIVSEIFYRELPGYPRFLEFTSIDYSKVIEYLHSRNSSFTNEQYLKTIYAVGEEYNVHPLLLLAIIGQEQGFVPRDNPYANRILNNPFNVYNSWTNYNTSLQDSCEVAAGTIRNILKERPIGENPFRWLNTRYAEDPNWWKGVQELFYTLLAHAE